MDRRTAKMLSTVALALLVVKGFLMILAMLLGIIVLAFVSTATWADRVSSHVYLQVITAVFAAMIGMGTLCLQIWFAYAKVYKPLCKGDLSSDAKTYALVTGIICLATGGLAGIIAGVVYLIIYTAWDEMAANVHGARRSRRTPGSRNTLRQRKGPMKV